MRFLERKIVLRDHRQATLRSPEACDAPALLACMQTIFTETEYLSFEPEEFTFTEEQEAAFLTELADSDDRIMILCEVDGRVVGNCHLFRQNKLRMQHRAELGISILREFWEQGIGSMMFDALIETGKELHLRQLELEVVAENERALRLYERKGFSLVGTFPNAMRMKDGRFLDTCYMVKLL